MHTQFRRRRSRQACGNQRSILSEPCTYSSTVADFVRSAGLDAYDRERAKHQAKERAHDLYDQHYVENQGANQYNPNEYGPPRHLQREERYGNEGGYGNDGGYGNQGGYRNEGRYGNEGGNNY